MAYRSPQYDDDSDEESHAESWDEDVLDEESENEDDDKSTVPCPYCRQPVYEDAEYCANCEEYISLEDAPPERKPLWIVVTVVLCLVSIFYLWIRI